MSRIPDNKNVGQKALYNIGQSEIGIDAANTSRDIEVRQHGWNKVKRIGAVGVATVVGVVSVPFLAKGFDNSPLAQKQKHSIEHPYQPQIDLGNPVYTPVGEQQPKPNIQTVPTTVEQNK